jgi:hypothetical protein
VSEFIPQLVSAAVIGAVSPVPAMVTIIILSARRAARNAIALLLGWSTLLVLLAVAMDALVGDSAAALGDNTKAIINLIIGQLLVSFALRVLVGARHPLARPMAGEPAPQAVPGWMRAVDRLTAPKAFALGAALLAISPANIAAYLAALQGLKGIDAGATTKLVLLLALIVPSTCASSSRWASPCSRPGAPRGSSRPARPGCWRTSASSWPGSSWSSAWC